MVETSRQKDVVPFSLPKGKIKGQDVDLPSIKKKKKDMDTCGIEEASLRFTYSIQHSKSPTRWKRN